MKYIVNPVTGDYESTSFTFRDRFALGGGVIQGEKVGSRENFAKPIIKPFAVSQAVVDKIDLDDVKRLRSKGFTVEKIANKYKISKGAMERIINANKNYFTKLTPADKLSKERLNALNKVTNFFIPGKKWADVSGDTNNPFYRAIIDNADRITGTGQKGASGISFAEFKKKYTALQTKKTDFEAAEKWILKNAKKYNDPVEMKKGFIKDLGSKNSFLTSSGTASEFFSEKFVDELLGGKEIKFEKGRTKSIVNNIFGSAIYNFNPKVRKQIVDALTNFAKKPMDTRYEARQFFNKPLFKKFGIDKQINGPISRLIAVDLGEKIYERVKQFRNPRMNTIKHVRYLSGVVGPKYKKEFLLAADAMEDAQRNLWNKAKQKLNIADAITFEHKIPQSFIDAGYADKIEYIKVTPTPRAFNEAKFRNFDSPMRKLMNVYEKTSNINEKKKIFSKMEDLKYDFSSKTGGYLDSVSMTDKDGKIRFSSTDEVISNPKQLRSLLEKNLKDVSNFAKSKGFTLNSFAGVLDLSQSGIEIPASVKRSMDNVLKVGGKIAKVGGKAAAVIDPLFAAMDFSKAIDKGVSGKQAASFTGKKFLQDIANLPRTLEDIAYLTTKKGTLENFGKKDDRLFSYKPAAFADKSLQEDIDDTAPEVLETRKAVRDFDVNVRSGMTMVDDMETPASKKEIDAAEEKFMKERGVDLSVLDNLPEITTDNQVAGALSDAFPGQSYIQFQQAIDDGFQGSFEEYLQQQSMKMAQGGRVNFGEGSPDPDFLNAISAARDNDNIPIGDKTFLGMKIADNPLQRFNEMIDPRAYPYYGQKIVEGASRIPEYAVRTGPALGRAAYDIATKRPEGKMDRFIKTITPAVTNKAQEAIGLTKLIQDAEKNRTGAQQQMGGQLEFLAEVPGPATPIGFLLKTPKYIRQLRGLTGSAAAAKDLENKIQEKVAVDQSRRDFNIMLGTGGVMAVVKALGLDKLISVGSKAAQKTAPIVTPGGTPQYFFDFVNLIKSKGDDISETAATVERQKVYDYKGYTLTEDLTTGEKSIKIADEDMGKGSEMTFKPGEDIVDEKTGKSVKSLDEYEEYSYNPDASNPGKFDSQEGMDDMDEILELLRKDGKKYSKEELLEMGIDADALGNYPTGAGSIPEGRAGEANPFKPKKAGGGIMKLAGDDSGPPPTSGPDSEGLALILKRGRKY